jgi:hypothetical protein
MCVVMSWGVAQRVWVGDFADLAQVHHNNAGADGAHY